MSGIILTYKTGLAGFPNAFTTGVPFGTALTPSGNVTVNVDGTLVTGLDIIGLITVNADNVTIQNCKINASGQNFGIGLQTTHKNLLVDHCEVYGVPITANRPASHVLTAIACDFDAAMPGCEIRFCDIHGIENAVGGGSLYIHDNYIHDFAIWQVGPDTDHTDGVQSGAANGVGGQTIIHNTIIAVCTAGDLASPSAPLPGSSCIALQTDMHDVMIMGNLLASGSNTIYGNAQNSIGSSVNTIIKNNTFLSQYAYLGGGVFSGFNPASAGFVWVGNTIFETGAVVAGPTVWPN